MIVSLGRGLATALLGTALAGAAVAQTLPSPPVPVGQAADPAASALPPPFVGGEPGGGPADCGTVVTGAAASGKAEPATPPEPASADGTAPGNSGSTGWSGGTGGSMIGTNPQGAVAVSRTWQPPTARGLDLKGVPDAVVEPAVATAPNC